MSKIPNNIAPFVDEKGLINPVWYRFLADLERQLNQSGSAVADATGGATIDSQARTAINGLLAQLRTLGVIAT
jgi:hypothetical protein